MIIVSNCVNISLTQSGTPASVLSAAVPDVV